MADKADKRSSLITKSLDELAEEMACLPETSGEANMYAEIARRQTQAALDAKTAQLASRKRKLSFWTILILGSGMLAELLWVFARSVIPPH
jgi:hypothetical protein